MIDVVPLRIRPPVVEILDQTRLPGEERYLALSTVEELCEAIGVLRIRGAPLLGLVGACGVAIAAENGKATDAELTDAGRAIASTRPTAVDLGAVAGEALRHALAVPVESRRATLWEFARAFAARRQQEDRAIGELGANLVPAGGAVLTHCNTGALATGGIGTALGIIRTAWEHGRLAHCYATETRPLLQGARLTMWELSKLGIPATLLPDAAAASLIASGRVAAVITGADRIAANGDAANKIGTYGLAVAAARRGIPFFIAAPTTTIDPACPEGASIPIEFRDESEVGGYDGIRWSPPGTPAYNPAFDVTPAELIAAIVTERGVARPPYHEAIARLLSQR